jgi:hypothetical protein
VGNWCLGPLKLYLSTLMEYFIINNMSKINILNSPVLSNINIFLPLKIFIILKLNSWRDDIRDYIMIVGSFKNLYITSTNKEGLTSTWGSSLVVNCVTCSFFISSSILYVHVCHPRGVLPTHWTCRMLNGPWRIVVVYASWPGHRTIIKKISKD